MNDEEENINNSCTSNNQAHTRFIIFFYLKNKIKFWITTNWDMYFKASERFIGKYVFHFIWQDEIINKQQIYIYM